MTKQIQVSVSDGDESINVVSNTPAEVARVLKLAGVELPQVQSAPPSEQEVGVPPAMQSADQVNNAGGICCGICGDTVHTEDACPQANMEEQADSDDMGDDTTPEAGYEVNPSTYIWQGAKNPQRLVKGFAGDNPLVSEVHNKLINEYQAFLSEADDRENAEGNMSPLSDSERINFDPDPFHGEKAVDDGSHSPMSTIERYPALD